MSVDLFGRSFYRLQADDDISVTTTTALPDVTDADNGSILKVIDGIWNKSTESIELPSVTSSDNGSVLQVVGGNWSKSTSISSAVTQITPNPTMTSDATIIDGLLYRTSASSVYTILNTFVWKAFKNSYRTSTNDCWIPEVSGTVNSWIQMQYPKAIIVDGFNINTLGNAGFERPITSWKIQGSNDGVSFTDIYSSTTTINNDIFTTFSFANNTPYIYYRFNILASEGVYDIRIDVFQWTSSTLPMDPRTILHNDTVYMKINAATNLNMNSKLINNLAPPVIGTDAVNKQYVDNAVTVTSVIAYTPTYIVPIMTSDTLPSGYIASASSVYGGNNAFNAFDMSATTFWHWSTTGTQWIQIQIPNGIAATKVEVMKRTTLTNLGNWTLAGSVNGTAFIPLTTQTSMPTTLTAYTFTNTVKYWYYRITFTTSSINSAGITAFNVMANSIGCSNYRLSNISDPINPQDCVTKNYIDPKLISLPTAAYKSLYATGVNTCMWDDYQSIHSSFTQTQFDTLPSGLYACFSSYLPSSRIGILPIDTKGYLICMAYQNGVNGVYNKRYHWHSVNNTTYYSWIVEGTWNTWITTIQNVTDPVNNQDVSTKHYVDTATSNSNYIKCNGSIAMTGNLNLASNRIVSLADSQASTDAATKSYVDSKISPGNNLVVYLTYAGVPGATQFLSWENMYASMTSFNTMFRKTTIIGAQPNGLDLLLPNTYSYNITIRFRGSVDLALWRYDAGFYSLISSGQQLGVDTISTFNIFLATPALNTTLAIGAIGGNMLNIPAFNMIVEAVNVGSMNVI